ncbi:MAG: transposon-encoded TnpW family protein [Oscillospiraceae bacterium]|nr:transposon-encoded TnpW family protein [Oscillospiraceae bacterium]
MKYLEGSERFPELEQALQSITDTLASMTKEDRLSWFEWAMYDEPVTFMREIGGTVYLVRSLFDRDADENIREKTERILKDTALREIEDQHRI